VQRRTLKSFLLSQAERVKKRALSMATEAQRPHQYLTGPTRKEDLAQQIAERDGGTEGLVCVFSVLEPCRIEPKEDCCSANAIAFGPLFFSSAW